MLESLLANVGRSEPRHCAIMMIIGMVPIWFWRSMSGLAYLFGLVLLVAVELFGEVRGGAQRWLDLKFMLLQPSELMKISLVMVLAAYYDWLPMSRDCVPCMNPLPENPPEPKAILAWVML